MTVQYQSNFDETIPFSDTCWQLALATGVDSSITIPGTAQQRYTMLLSYTYASNVFVCNGATATVPGAGLTTTQFYEEFRPGADGTKRNVKGTDVIHFITPDASAYVGVRLMAVPG